MKALLIVFWCSALVLAAAACRDNASDQDTAEATTAGQTGGAGSLPDDVLLVTNAIVEGELYSRPSFNGLSVARFDTSHQIQVLDTTDQLFVRARVMKDTTAFMGYVSKAILPE